jgi:hypothetical protein
MNDEKSKIAKCLFGEKKLKNANTHNKFKIFQKRKNGIFKLFETAQIKV